MCADRYMIVYDWMTEQIGSGAARDVYALLYGYSHECSEQVQMQSQYLCERLHISKRQFAYAMNYLESIGAVKIDRHIGRGASNTFEVVNIKGAKIAPFSTEKGAKIACFSDIKGAKIAPFIYNINNNNIIKEIDKEKEKSKRFRKPTIDEVTAYCIERENGIDASAFVDFYESKGWVVGKSPMKDWKAAVRTWERKNKEYGKERNDSITSGTADRFSDLRKLANTKFGV